LEKSKNRVFNYGERLIRTLKRKISPFFDIGQTKKRMAEVTTPRLMAAAKEFNIGKDTLVDFLISKGFGDEDLKPTSKLTEPMYRVLQTEFQQDKVAHEKAMQIDLPKGASVSEPKKKKDEQDLSFTKKETKAKPAEEEKPAEAAVTEAEPVK
jgi:translation initiation factor IF-2